MKLKTLLDRIDEHQVRQIDIQFASFLLSLQPSHTQIEVAAFLVSYELGKGHVCLDFSQPHEYVTAQELDTLFEGIQACELICHVSDERSVETAPQEIKPLVLHGHCLYMQRYYEYEQALDLNIQTRLQAMPWQVSDMHETVQNLFSVSPSDTDINWQAVAACIAAQNKFSVISGGPGTGKTTTVIRLLALIVQLYVSHYQRNPIIKLAAPTGKAAMRLTESIVGAKESLAISMDIKNVIPHQAETLHRLLQRNANGAFRFNRNNPLHLDVLIVDEASMVDLPLMAKLVQAMPAHGQIILLGDKDQLASVEAGSVLADICDNEIQHGYSQGLVDNLTPILGGDFTGHLETSGADIRDFICHLKRSYRFHEHSGIGHLARAANAGDFFQWQQVAAAQYSDLSISGLSEADYQAFIEQAAAEVIARISALDPKGLTDHQVIETHQAYGGFQILCALKEGPLGVAGVNLEIEKRLKWQGLMAEESKWYTGRPIIVLENDYGLNLYNGDIGILLPHETDDGQVKLKATFIGTDNKVRWIQPSRLPKHDTVYAMTVHKSQGSEFDHCAFILPDYPAPVLTKELIYTGITRAKNKLTLLCNDGILKTALYKKVQRASGLGSRLWHDHGKHIEESRGRVRNTMAQRIEKEGDSIVENNPSQISLF